MINNILSEYFHYLQIQMQVIFICIAAWRKVPQAAAAPCVKIPSPRLPQRRPKPSFFITDDNIVHYEKTPAPLRPVRHRRRHPRRLPKQEHPNLSATRHIRHQRPGPAGRHPRPRRNDGCRRRGRLYRCAAPVHAPLGGAGFCQKPAILPPRLRQFEKPPRLAGCMCPSLSNPHPFLSGKTVF